MKVLLTGAYPPLIGGNSMHVQRLREALRRQRVDCDVIDPYGEASAAETDKSIHRIGPPGFAMLLRSIRLIRAGSYDVCHFHVSAMERFVYAGWFLLLICPLRAKKVLTVHSGSFVEAYMRAGPLRRALVRLLIVLSTHVIVVNAEQRNFLSGIVSGKHKINVIPAYFPPVLRHFDGAEAMLARLREGGRLLIVSSGYGEELYGYHFIAAAIAANPEINARVGLVLCLYNTFDEQYMRRIDADLQGLESYHVFRGLPAEHFAFVLSRGDIYVRATRSDGDAVAVREADYFGLRTIASDAVARPAFCELFPSGDSVGLARALRLCLTEEPARGCVNREPPVDAQARIFDLYGIGRLRTVESPP